MAGMDADTKRDFLKETMKEFRDIARDDLRERYPELNVESALPSSPRAFAFRPCHPALYCFHSSYAFLAPLACQDDGTSAAFRAEGDCR